MLLINGEKDSQVPIEDLYLPALRLAEGGVDQSARRTHRSWPGWPDGKLVTEVALSWLSRAVNAKE